jgi:hypothetical protein
MSERTDTKLRETKFFFQSLVRESDKESPSEPEAFLFYLNAFVTLYGLRDHCAMAVSASHIFSRPQKRCKRNKRV